METSGWLTMPIPAVMQREFMRARLEAIPSSIPTQRSSEISERRAHALPLVASGYLSNIHLLDDRIKQHEDGQEDEEPRRFGSRSEFAVRVGVSSERHCRLRWKRMSLFRGSPKQPLDRCFAFHCGLKREH